MAVDQRSRAEHDRLLEPYHRVVEGALALIGPFHERTADPGLASDPMAFVPSVGSCRRHRRTGEYGAVHGE